LRSGVRVDTQRLTIQWLLVAVVTAAAILTLQNGATTDRP